MTKTKNFETKMNGFKIDVGVHYNPKTNYGSFEYYDIRSGGDYVYGGGGIWTEGNVVVDYDGVFALPSFVADVLDGFGLNTEDVR